MGDDAVVALPVAMHLCEPARFPAVDIAHRLADHHFQMNDQSFFS
jgi:hypothetical protein